VPARIVVPGDDASFRPDETATGLNPTCSNPKANRWGGPGFGLYSL